MTNTECPICLCDVQEKSKKLSCGHLLHEECGKGLAKAVCPLCNKPIKNLTKEEKGKIQSNKRKYDRQDIEEEAERLRNEENSDDEDDSEDIEIEEIGIRGINGAHYLFRQIAIPDILDKQLEYEILLMEAFKRSIESFSEEKIDDIDIAISMSLNDIEPNHKAYIDYVTSENENFDENLKRAIELSLKEANTKKVEIISNRERRIEPSIINNSQNNEFYKKNNDLEEERRKYEIFLNKVTRMKLKSDIVTSLNTIGINPSTIKRADGLNKAPLVSDMKKALINNIKSKIRDIETEILR